MKKLWDTRDKTGDITFKIDNTEIKAHRCVLLVSEIGWFETILNGRFAEAKSDLIEVKECSLEVFTLGLQMAYSTFLNEIPPIDQAFKAASFFSIPYLVNMFTTAWNDVEICCQAHQYEPVFNDLIKSPNYETILTLQDERLDVALWAIKLEGVSRNTIRNYVMDDKARKDVFIAMLETASDEFIHEGDITKIDINLVHRLIRCGVWKADEAIKIFLYKEKASITCVYPLEICLAIRIGESFDSTGWTFKHFILQSPWENFSSVCDEKEASHALWHE